MARLIFTSSCRHGANRISLNMSKTHLMCFGRAHRDGELLDGYLAIKFYQHVNLCGRLASGCFTVRATLLELGYEMALSELN